MDAMSAATPLSAPFWDGCRRGELRVQICKDCGRGRFYPTEACPRCASTDSEWTALSGKGTLYSWTVVHRSVDAEWQARTPYIAAIVEPVEHPGVRIPGLLTGIDSAALKADLPVEVWFEDLGDGHVVHRWRPRTAE